MLFLSGSLHHLSISEYPADGLGGPSVDLRGSYAGASDDLHSGVQRDLCLHQLRYKYEMIFRGVI